MAAPPAASVCMVSLSIASIVHTHTPAIGSERGRDPGQGSLSAPGLCYFSHACATGIPSPQYKVQKGRGCIVLFTYGSQ